MEVILFLLFKLYDYQKKNKEVIFLEELFNIFFTLKTSRIIINSYISP